MSPEHSRCMHRTTIEGDYGLGRFEGRVCEVLRPASR